LEPPANNRLQVTGNSVRSFLAPAISRTWSVALIGSRGDMSLGIIFLLNTVGRIKKIGPPPAPLRLNAVGAAALRAVAHMARGLAVGFKSAAIRGSVRRVTD
jgi:hypothetical protein